jgi:hypothetical protein
MPGSFAGKEGSTSLRIFAELWFSAMAILQVPISKALTPTT